jgi:hypothetical protein
MAIISCAQSVWRGRVKQLDEPVPIEGAARFQALVTGVRADAAGEGRVVHSRSKLSADGGKKCTTAVRMFLRSLIADGKCAAGLLLARFCRFAPGHRSNGVFSHAEEAVSAAATSIGQPLPAHLQNRCEQSLKADPSGVRIYAGLSLPRRAMRSVPGLTLAATIFISTRVNTGWGYRSQADTHLSRNFGTSEKVAVESV